MSLANGRPYLAIPGPSVLPDRILAAMQRPSPNIYAGALEYGGIGDPNEALGTLWYHDHVADHTAGNVYQGLAGMVQQFDAFDSDNENDPSPTALRLPSGQYDVPLAFSDYILNTDGSLFFDQLEDKGQAGNLFVVNGKIQPYFNVAARKYRFRLLDAAGEQLLLSKSFADGKAAGMVNKRLQSGEALDIREQDGGFGVWLDDERVAQSPAFADSSACQAAIQRLREALAPQE